MIGQMKKITLILLVNVIVIAAAMASYRFRNDVADHGAVIHNPDEPGGKYLADLLAAIQNADVITIAEHSDMIDYWRPDRSVDGYKEKIYEVVQISQTEKRGLIEMVRSLDTTTQNAFAACTFNPHHRIAFYKDGKLTSTMEVCFECGDIEWKGSSQLPPWSIYGGMKAYISSIGLHPKAEWWKKYESSVTMTQSDTWKAGG